MAQFASGTRYSDSDVYDVATDRNNEFGDTIFIQFRPDGTPTGRESVVIDGRLYGVDVAAQVHRGHLEAAAPDLLREVCELIARLQRIGVDQPPTPGWRQRWRKPFFDSGPPRPRHRRKPPPASLHDKRHDRNDGRPR